MVDTASGLETETVDAILDAIEACDAWEIDASTLARIGGAK